MGHLWVVESWLLSSRFSVGFSIYRLALVLQKFAFNIYWVQMPFVAEDLPAELLAAPGMGSLGRCLSTVSLMLGAPA